MICAAIKEFPIEHVNTIASELEFGIDDQVKDLGGFGVRANGGVLAS